MGDTCGDDRLAGLPGPSSPVVRCCLTDSTEETPSPPPRMAGPAWDGSVGAFFPCGGRVCLWRVRAWGPISSPLSPADCT